MPPIFLPYPLQNFGQLDVDRLRAYVEYADRRKLRRVLPQIVQVMVDEFTAYVSL